MQFGSVIRIYSIILNRSPFTCRVGKVFLYPQMFWSHSRLYWCGLPLLPFWKKCTVLGFWNSCWIMHYTLHALGSSYKFLLFVYRGTCISSSGVCCCLLCLWISPNTKSKVQSSGSTMRRFDDPLILSLVCHMPRVQGDPWENRQ